MKTLSQMLGLEDDAPDPGKGEQARPVQSRSKFGSGAEFDRVADDYRPKPNPDKVGKFGFSSAFQDAFDPKRREARAREALDRSPGKFPYGEEFGRLVEGKKKAIEAEKEEAEFRARERKLAKEEEELFGKEDE